RRLPPRRSLVLGWRLGLVDRLLRLVLGDLDANHGALGGEPRRAGRVRQHGLRRLGLLGLHLATAPGLALFGGPARFLGRGLARGALGGDPLLLLALGPGALRPGPP